MRHDIPKVTKTPMSELLEVYIYGEITNPENYIEEISTIRNAGENDTVKIYLNTPGGHLPTALAIVKAIEECRGQVVSCIDNQCCSAGTLIFLSADAFEISEECIFMVHTYSTGMYGKGHELDLQVGFEKKWFAKLAKKFYSNFLFEDEILRVIDGKDLWMDAEEVTTRCKWLVEQENNNIDSETE